MNSQALKKLKMPDVPGVYFFKKGSDTLYIGKATSLRDRVKSYFGKDLIETRGPHILDMVFKANGLKWQTTDSVLEALILEANLIKKYKPYYNTKEKDDKSFLYVVITEEALPKLLLIRGKDLQEKIRSSKPEILNKSKIPNTKHESYSQILKNMRIDTTYGPFTQGSQLKEALKIIRRIFPFIDSSSAQKDKYEFYRQLGLTPDVADSAVQKEYRKTIRNLKLFFEGKKARIVSTLKKEMMQYAKRQEFEKADIVKRQIFALEHIHDVSLIKEENIEEGTIKQYRIEAYDIAHMSGKNMVGVMTVVSNGVPDKNEYRKFIIRTQSGSNDVGALEEVLSRRLRHSEWGLPSLIVVDGGIAQKNIAERVLKRYQFSIPVVAVVKNERHKPERLLGDKAILRSREGPILLANSEAHRFGIKFHKQKRSKNFLPE